MRALATLWVLSPLLAFGAGSFAAPVTRWENPHGAFREDCGMCHRAEAWLPAKVSRKFDHGARNGFPLDGAHAAASCLGCHATLEFKQSRMNCASCHEDIHRGEMGTDCQRCHSARSFTDVSTMRRLHQTTRFPLVGGHAGLDCQSCHKPAAAGQMQFVGTRAACADCHMADYRATQDPDHSAGFSTDCTQCHTALGWHTARFDHAASGFPLTGAHQAVACTACHKNNQYKGTSKECVACHRADYDGTTSPAHTAAGFPVACTTCHTTTTWIGAVFNHSATAFPLTGAHRATACTACHGDGVYQGKRTDCYACHGTDYNSTTDPKHTLPSFPTTCTTCHTTIAWAGAALDHSKTAFPLTGAHRATACTACHGDGVYKGKSTDCYACHVTDYNATADPRHSLPAFPITCTSCHNTTAWAGASFNHSTTAFPLTGAHVTAACAGCHSDGVYKGKSTACVSCHLNDFNTAVDPNHPGAGISTTCTGCHNTTAWAGARVNHDTPYFKIYSGKHKGRWDACADCHNVPSNYAQFNCLDCHGKSQTDSHHNGRSGYSYVSSACYSCHRGV